MKVIFLDFDGVICTRDSIAGAHEFAKADKSGDRNLYSAQMIDPILVGNLNEVVKETGAVVVVSSAWRHLHDMKEVREFLRINGFLGKVIDRTPVWKEYKDEIGVKTTNDLERFWEYERGNEIKMWLDKHPEVESFVILDDEISDIFPVFPYNYIRTDMENGFHEGLIKEVIKMLNKEED